MEAEFSFRKRKLRLTDLQIERNEGLLVSFNKKRIPLKITSGMNFAEVPSVNLNMAYRCINSERKVCCRELRGEVNLLLLLLLQ